MYSVCLQAPTDDPSRTQVRRILILILYHMCIYFLYIYKSTIVTKDAVYIYIHIYIHLWYLILFLWIQSLQQLFPHFLLEHWRISNSVCYIVQIPCEACMTSLLMLRHVWGNGVRWRGKESEVRRHNFSQTISQTIPCDDRIVLPPQKIKERNKGKVVFQPSFFEGLCQFSEE